MLPNSTLSSMLSSHSKELSHTHNPKNMHINVLSFCLSRVIVSKVTKARALKASEYLGSHVECTYNVHVHVMKRFVSSAVRHWAHNDFIRVLPRINWRPSEWAWFGRSLWPHQSFWLPHQRNKAVEGMGGHYAERAWVEHCLCMYILYSRKYWRELNLVVGP